MEQNSTNWLEWRRQGIGASDAPIIMGVSPWKTPFQLWEEKMGFTTSVGNFATQRGHDLEPKARALFELNVGEEFPPTLAVHKEFPFLRASLDGFNKELNAILEIKCPGQEDHETALAGKIPEKYWPQLQHQLLVTGAEKCYYYSFDGESGCKVEAFPDPEYCAMLFNEIQAFWEKVVTKTPPPLSARDSVDVTTAEAVALAKKYEDTVEQIKLLEIEQAALKTKLLPFCNHPKTKIGRLNIVRSVRTGNVDYSKIPEISGVDVEKYRKAPTATVTITIAKK